MLIRLTLFIFPYYLVFSDNRIFIGYMNTKIEYSSISLQWEFKKVNNSEVIAVTNDTKEMPIGVHKWYFSSKCHDPGKPWRLLNLHRDVLLPGHFCCGDGHCIQSELVCDSIPHCFDESDEYQCSSGHNIECVGWWHHSSQIFLILLFTKPNKEVCGWLYQTKTHITHIVYQPFSIVTHPNYIALRVTKLNGRTSYRIYH